MMPIPKYAQRFARLPAAFEQLAAHPAGMPITELAARFGVQPNELREDLLAFFTADVLGMLGLSRPSVLEFVGPDGRDNEPNEAEIVRIVEERPSEELGVEYVDASELALIYAAGRALLEIHPEDEDLADAIGVLTETMFGETLPQSGQRSWNRPLEPLQEAAQTRHRVRIEYSRSWRAGVTNRVIEPYRVVQTRRGWEVDAGPVDEHGSVRSYLLSNIRSLDVLDETFDPPVEVTRLLAEQRETTRVRVRIPHPARWAADMYAEEVIVVVDDEQSVTLDLELLPPFEHRVGLFLLACGPEAAVLDPPGAVEAVRALARELLDHHRR